MDILKPCPRGNVDKKTEGTYTHVQCTAVILVHLQQRIEHRQSRWGQNQATGMHYYYTV